MTEYGYSFDYSKTMMMKLFLSSPNVRGGGSYVNCTFEKALEVIRQTDALTLGVPKIIYLVVGSTTDTMTGTPHFLRSILR